MSKVNHTFRELIYLGSGWGQDLFAAESDSMRLAGRGGMGYCVNISMEGVDGVHCNCPAAPDCWHVREAPNALNYWRIRLKHGEMSREQFDAFYQQWWPKRTAIMERAKQGGEFKGKSETGWGLFFSALLDEFNTRSVAYGKLERTFGAELLDAMGLGAGQKETA